MFSFYYTDKGVFAQTTVNYVIDIFASEDMENTPLESRM